MRKVLVAIGVVSMFSMVAAQKLEVGIDGAYGLPAGTTLAGHNTIIDTVSWTAKTYEEVYSSGGKGWKMTGEVVYYPFENIGIIAIAGYSTNNRYDTCYKAENGSSMSTDTVTSSHIPLNIGIKIKTKIGIAEPYLYVAPGVIFPSKTETFFDASNSLTIKKTYSYSMGFSVTSGFGAAIMVSKKIGIKMEFSPTYAFATSTGYKETRKDNNGTSERTITYKNNTPISQLKQDEIQSQPHDSFCSMAFKAGMCFKLF
jgi:hypothetical protein